MMEYLTPRLWEPLGIKHIFWESCPAGITKGGWGLFYLSGRHGKIRAALSKPRHMARKADHSGRLDPRIDHKTG